MSFDVFENISFEKLNSLYELSKNNSRDISNLKLAYSRNNDFLQENLNFLIDIDILQIQNNNILTNENQYDNFKNLVFNKISKKPIYASLIKNYLENFIINSENQFSFKPDDYYNRVTSDLRNFLISMNVLKLVDDNYIILDKNIFSFFKKTQFSPQQLKKKIEQQEKIGLDAEKLIFQNELENIKKIDKNLSPDHVSLRDVSAGYDIQSYESYNNKIKKIFIEVKAVSKSNYKFHLSVQEIQTANNYKDSYYLYLLPVDYSKQEKFDLSKIIKINNINKNILQNKINWKIDSDGLVITKIK